MRYRTDLALKSILTVLIALTALSAAHSAEMIPGPLTVQVRSAADQKPISGVTVHVGGRMAISDQSGQVVFDGIPTGSYLIKCQHPGYLLYEQTVQLPNGQRPNHEIILTGETMAPVRWRFIEETSGEPVAQARVRLKPKNIDAAFSGPIVITSDRDGNISTLGVPEGTYDLKIVAPGYADIEQVYEHRTVEQPTEFKFQAVSQQIGYTVSVQDPDGTPVPQAQVTLYEVYPLARIATSRSDAQGRVQFTNLRLGIVNPLSKEGNLSVAHRAEAVVRVEAEGCIPSLQSLRLREQGQLAVTLHRQVTLQEQQANDTSGQAQSIIPGQAASFKLDQLGDQDWFKFELPEAAQVTAVVNNCPISTSLDLFDGSGSRIGGFNKYASNPARGTWNLGAGRYTIQVTSWGSARSDAEIIMTLSAEVAADPMEDNNTPAGARSLHVGQHLRGMVFPDYDRDYFTLHLDRPGVLRLESVNAPPLSRTVLIQDRDQNTLASMNCYGSNGGVAEWRFEPGDYFVVVTYWGSAGCSLAPYDFRFKMITDDEIDDPAIKAGTPLSAVRSLEPGMRTYASINPAGDQDVYSVPIPSKGILHVFQYGPTGLTATLLNNRGESLGHGNSYANNASHWTRSFNQADTVYLAAQSWGTGEWSPMPYELRLWFDPSGEIERLVPNETLKTAVPIELGEYVRDNILPLGDQDWYQVMVDQPGLLRIWNRARPGLSVTLYDARQNPLGTLNSYYNNENEHQWPVLPGIHYLYVRSWGSSEAPWDYTLQTTLNRAVPGETPNMAQNPVKALKFNEAQPCGIEHIGDVERFHVSIPAKGDYRYWIGGPLSSTTTVVDRRTGQNLFSYNAYGSNTGRHDFSTEGPMELALIVTAWGTAASIQPNWIMVGHRDSGLTNAAIDWKVNPVKPTEVTFSIAGTPGVTTASEVSLDLNADGQAEATLTGEEAHTLEFPKQGLYRVVTWGRRDNNQARGEVWVQATGQPVREGIHVQIATPGEGEWIEHNVPARVAALSYEGKPIRQVVLTVDGKTVGADYQAPYEFEVPWQSLAGGQRSLIATAVDTTGKQEICERTVHVTDYFNLLPADGAIVTGNDVTVSWDGSAFGSARVRFRPKPDGETEQSWQEAVGANGRTRRVRLTALEPDRVYEYQPIGGPEAGPVREVTRVRGLAFTEAHYGGTILRDYDQKIPVAVRNHAEQPRVVRLRCDLPKDSLLLAEFVGEGEKGRPVELAPGEQRSFTLGFSAQDVVKEEHHLPIYIQSEDGYTDQAAVTVRVKLPKVDLQWQDVTPANHTGMGRTLELVNHGDTLTDVQIKATRDQVNIQPEVEHGLLQAGHRMRFEVYPKLYDGFTACDDQITATSIGKQIAFDYKDGLKPGETVYRLDMTAGLNPLTGEPNDIDEARRAARRLVGQYLSAATVDWTAGAEAQDTNRDGKPDRWAKVDTLNQTQWFGRDTDGDGAVDFAQADVGLDGEIDHSSLLEDGRWRSTNLLDAWLEMNFSIPKHRSQYQPHDVDLIVNSQIVGQLEQTIPEGNYRFGLSPTALAWAQNGKPGDNQLEIKSRFLNYAHYAISSDFQLKTRLLATDTFMVGTSREDALKKLYESDPGFTTDQADYSLSSEDLEITPVGDITKGDPVTLTGTVRNLGIGAGDRLQIGLFLAVPGTEGQEMERIEVDSPGMMTDETFKFVWAAAPGHHSLRVVVDPNELVDDINRKNNAAIVNLTVPGEDSPPDLTVVIPQDRTVTDSGHIGLLAQATDDTGVIAVEVAVDSGAMQNLYRTDEGFAGGVVLQTGSHTLRFRATDSGNQRTEVTREVMVESPQPTCEIVSPASGATIDDSNVPVTVSASDVEQVAVRVNNGPWIGLPSSEETWAGTVDLTFGPCEIEAVAIDEAGMRRTAKVNVTCMTQPKEEGEQEQEQDEEEAPEDEQDTDIQGKGPEQEPKPQDQTQVTPDSEPARQGDTQNPPKTGRQPQDQQPQSEGQETPTGSGTGSSGRPSGGKGKESGGADQSDGSSTDNELIPPADEPPADQVEPSQPVDIPEPDLIIPPAGHTARAPSRPSPTQTRPNRNRARQNPKGFAYNRQRNDWYCPNRTHIKVNFKLPEWLTKEEFDKILKKGPNSKEFKALEAKLLAGYWYRNFGKKVKGQTMDQLLLKYKEMLLKRCGRLDQADGKLPSFLQSLGFAADDPPTDPRELEAWRNKMKELTEVYWLRLLATEDPSVVIDGMRQRADALGKFDEASQMQAEAVIEEIQANQKITQDVLEALPYAGEALDVIAAVTGESLSGEQLGGWERFFRAACVAGPAALEEALKRSPRAQKAIGEFLQATDEMSSQMKNSMLKRLGMDIDKFDQFADDALNILTKERRVFSKKADDVVDAAKTGYKQTAEGMADLRQMEKAREASQEAVDELKDVVKRGGMAGDAEMEDVILRLQKDKTAQSIMNSADVPPPVRKRANETIKRIYDDADIPTMKRIKESDDVRKFAEAHGINPEDVEITVWNPTNKKGPRAGEPGYVDPDFVKYGRDRDVTYQMKHTTKDGQTVTMDVNHDISGPIYQEELYKRCHGGKLPDDMVDVKKFSADMDQMVTSKWHREAYNTGPDVHIDDWLNNDITPPVARPEDIRDTIITKSDHWFGEAAKAGRDSAKYSKDMAEGMRQATKQWDNFIAKRAALYGTDVPVQLEKAMDIFKQVEKGTISPKQAEHMLEHLGNMTRGTTMTPKKVVENMAHFFEGMEKGPGKAFRNIKTKHLADALDGVGDMTRKTDMITDAYRSGHISGETYRQMRQGTFKLPPNPTPQQKEALHQWALSAWHRRGISVTEKKLIEEQVGLIE